MKKFPATLLCDFYKISHKDLYPVNTKRIYSTLTPRTNKYFTATNVVVVFAIQAFVKKYLIEYFNENFFARTKEEVVNEYVRYIKHTLGVKEPNASHIAALHDLGYLPIRLKALKEGTKAPIKTPILTIENTHDDFFWLTNYLETILSAETWQPMTNATMALQFRTLLDEYAMKTVGHTDDVAFQGHDFSFRGMTNVEAAAASGAGHLLYFIGTDDIPAIGYLEEYYNANIEKEIVGTSIPATEHSVMCANTDADTRDEYDYFKEIITEKHPEGFVSIVSDSYDFWDVVGRVIPSLKKEIMERDGRVVIRPDSGDPVEILMGKDIQKFESHEEAEKFLEVYDGAIYEVDGEHFIIEYVAKKDTWVTSEYELTLEDTGLIEALWDVFGGTVTKKGYKQLDGHIGAIYGDSITLERAREIVQRLEKKGFASTSVVLGIGSYTYTYNTRDSLGFTIKATYGQFGDEEKLLFKDPKTDPGKRSQRGRVFVYEEDGVIKYVDGLKVQDELELEKTKTNLLETVFENGVLVRDQTLQEVREIANK